MSACAKNIETLKVNDKINNTAISPTATRQSNIVEVSKNEAEPIITVEEMGTFCIQCASYKISIFPDRNVIFEGESFVKSLASTNNSFVKKKTVTKQRLPEAKLQKLVAEFENIGFLGLSDKYISEQNCPENWSDASTVHIYYRSDKKLKTIDYYRGCRGSEELEHLDKLMKYIDTQFKTNDWLYRSFLANTNTSSQK